MRAGEIGTGAGVGAAWIVSGLPPQVPFFTAELDPDLAARSAELFADDPNVIVLAGPWRASLPAEAPFDLLFVDAHDAKDDVEAVVGLLAPGGTAVLDDFWSDPALPDARRDAWLRPPVADHDRALGHTRATGARRSSQVAATDSGYPCR